MLVLVRCARCKLPRLATARIRLVAGVAGVHDFSNRPVPQEDFWCGACRHRHAAEKHLRMAETAMSASNKLRRQHDAAVAEYMRRFPDAKPIDTTTTKETVHQ